jgi:hypothetical protein
LSTQGRRAAAAWEFVEGALIAQPHSLWVFVDKVICSVIQY